MGQLINDLLSLSRITRVELRVQEVDLSAMAESLGAELAASEPARKVIFSVQEGLLAQADPSLLRIVLDNLLSNAWKFTGLNVDARVEVGAGPHGGESVFFVRDNGAGFDMQYADKLFGPFERLHTDEEFSGTGIGLAIVDRIVRRHGGHASGEGVPGKGATFRFTFGVHK
jgi:signal transduction histidine kinase